MEIKIRKKSGALEALDISKIKKQSVSACMGLKNVNSDELELDSNIQFVNDMQSRDIQEILIKTAIGKIDLDKPDWTFVASRLFRNQLYKDVSEAYNVKSTNIYDRVTLKDYIDLGVKDKALRPELLEVDLEYLNSKIQPNNDDNFNYLGILTLKDKYIKNKKKTRIPFELPQHLFMANAIAININETENKLEKILELYNSFSTFELFMATPSLSNARLLNKSLFSCFVGSSPDSLEGIMEGYKEQAFISKLGGGIGWDYSRMRSRGSWIDGNIGASAGKVPFMQFNNALVNAVDQLGVRKGAIKVFIEVWDLDIYDFIDLKKQSGEERRRTHDLFTSISINDIFMERVIADEDYTLFDPYEAKDLCETSNEAFRKNYLELEEQAKDGKIRHKTIKAKDLWKYIILSYFETGSPDLFFKDTANKSHKNKHLGTIRSLNLCQEFMNPVNEDEIAVCNLASINFGKVKTVKDLRRVVKIAVRALDNVIDTSSYPVAKAEKTQKRRRAIGLGWMGEAELLASKRIMFGSKEHEEFLHEFGKAFQETAIQTSHELALEKGVYPDWEGSTWHEEGIEMRNGYLTCLAPTSSISILAGTTQTIEPVYKRKWFEENMSGLVPVVVPNLNLDNWEYYVPAYEVDQLKSIEMNAIRQKYIDMAISFNIFVDPEKITGKDLHNILIKCWKDGLKSTYYLRSKSKEQKQDVADRSLECSGCQ